METHFILKPLGMTINRGNVVSYMRVTQPATSTHPIAQYLLEGGSDLMLHKKLFYYSCDMQHRGNSYYIDLYYG